MLVSPTDRSAANWRTPHSYARLARKYRTRAEKHRKVRKVPAPTAASFEFDDFTVDLGQRTLYRRGEPLPLPSRAFDTLVYLIEHRHRCVRKDEIIGTIWHDVVVTDDSLIHAISVLRRALGDERHQPKFIQTVPRRGYRFVADVKTPQAGVPAQDSAAEDAAATPNPGSAGDEFAETPPIAASASRLGHTHWLTAGVCVAAAAAALLWLADSRPPAEASLPSGIQLFQPAPAGASLASGGVLSPDGKYLAFVAS